MLESNIRRGIGALQNHSLNEEKQRHPWMPPLFDLSCRAKRGINFYLM
jgi:hypothetical protein